MGDLENRKMASFAHRFKGPVWVSSAIALLALILVPSASAADCTNEPIRKAQTSESFPLGTTTLPACMALEMVSPPKKFGQETLKINAFSRDGSRALFFSKAALGGSEGLQSFASDPYVAIRGAGGWTVSPTSPPSSAEISGGGNPEFGSPFAFSPDLGKWGLFGADQAQRFGGEVQLFTGGLGGRGDFAPLSPLLTPINDSGSDELGLIPAFMSAPGTSEDVSAVVFRAGSTSTSFLQGDPRETSSSSLYLAFRDSSGGSPAVRLLARDQSGKVWGGRCGTVLGGSGHNQGAVSRDGSRILFTTRPAQPFDETKVGHPEENAACNTSNPQRIMIRTGSDVPQIEELIPGGPSEAGDDLFEAGSEDGSKVFFASPRKLAGTDQDASAEACSTAIGSSVGCDLYLYDSDRPVGSRLVQASAGEDISGKHEEGKGADVLSGAAAIAPDGSRAYFVAQGVLTADLSPDGKSPVANKPNLYLYDAGANQVTFIATVSEEDAGRVWGGEPFGTDAPYAVPLLGGAKGGDGHILFFVSKASLAINDQDAGKADIYRYDSSDESLLCISCAAGPDSQPANVSAGSSAGSAGSNFAEFGRWASDDGKTVAFATAAALTPEDEDTDVNSYLWREGQLQRLPGVINELIYYRLPTVSVDGQEVGFTTTKALLPIDGDSTRDAYVVKVEGGYPNPAPSIPCDPLSEGACQGPSSAAPAIPTPATPFFSGPANQRQPTCRKSQVKRRGKCVKKKHRQKGKKASHKTGGSK